MRYVAFIILVAALNAVCLGEGYGSYDFTGSGNSVLRAAAVRSSADTNFIAVGRIWDASTTTPNYKALIASYRTVDGAQDLNFATSSGYLGKQLIDLAGAGYDNLCNAVVYAYDGFIAACRSMTAAGYYDTYLVKFDNSGNLNASFGTGGIVTTGIGGSATPGHAFPRGIAYSAGGGTLGHGGVIAVVGSVGFYSPGNFHPFIMLFDQQTGAALTATTTRSDISGTAVGVVNDLASGGIGYFYVASTETSGSHHFYVDRYDYSLTAASAPWGAAIDFTGAGGGTDSIPAAIALSGSDVVVAGSTRTGSGPWSCAVVGVGQFSGALDTNYNVSGANVFTPNASYDCILNAAAVPPSNTALLVTGTAHNGTNYDYLSAELDPAGGLISGFGSSGIQRQASGPADDVLNASVFVGTSAATFCSAGRALNAQLYNGAVTAQTTTTIPAAASDSWSPMTTTGAPVARGNASAVWTGSKLVVWGGSASGVNRNDGGIYDPSTNSWTATTTVGAPSARVQHNSVWTGSKMIIWGGSASGVLVNDGALFDPVANAWTPTTTTGAPGARNVASAVWTGTKMIVWGGANGAAYYNTGGIYDPAADSWTATTTTSAPSIREAHVATWTGSRLFIWGGFGGTYLNDGGLYDPSANSWTSVTTSGAPAIRDLAQGVWSGKQVLVFGGFNGTVYLNTGGLYDPSVNQWTTMTTTAAPALRDYYAQVWTGGKMLVWGGYNGTIYLNTGGAYDPSANSWVTMTSTGAPGVRGQFPTVWTGSKMIFWGGVNGTGTYTNDGGIYLPADVYSGSGGTFTTKTSDTWTAITTTGAPTARTEHTAVWTGSKMIIWGGYSFGPLNTGGQYDPVTDSWTATTTSGAPAVRWYHVAVWSGSKMLIWGGFGTAVLNSGGMYDPTANSWVTMTTTGSPSKRQQANGMWTGSKMMVFGGTTGTVQNTGGLFNPTTNTWSATTTVGAPPASTNQAVVWAGTRAVVWGGFGTTATNAGALYNPTTNSWTAMTTTGAPSARQQMAYTWTGSRLLIWGGNDGAGTNFNDGGQYNLTANSWTAMTTAGAPANRIDFDTVWTGSKMIIWGGQDYSGSPTYNTGAAYDPVHDVWTDTTTAGAPPPRWFHTFLWTGSRVIEWGGQDDTATYTNDGAFYNP